MPDSRTGPFARLRPWGPGFLVFGLALACYWPALRGALLWDDPGHVTRPDLQSWAGLARIWTDVHATQQFYPVLHSAFWFEHRLWGDATLGYHVLNVLLHATSCCLLALALRRLWTTPSGRSVPAGAEWFAALVFAVHPVCVESVAWISEQKNTLSLVFYLLAALAYLRFWEHRRWQTYMGATVLFLLALGTKSVTATLPAALLVVLWWKKGSLSFRRDAAPLLPWFSVALVSGAFTAWVERKLIGAEGVEFELSLVERFLLAGRVTWFYAQKLILPMNQAFFYERWDVPGSAHRWAGYLLAAAAVTATLWAVRRHCRGPLAGWLLFIGSLFPALGFFNVYPFVFSYVADHFQYLPSVSFIATATGAGAIALARSTPLVRRMGPYLGAIIIGTLCWLSIDQSKLYVNDESLFRATLARSPRSWMAHHILGFNLAVEGGRGAEAISEYREAPRLNPDYPNAHIGLGIELSRLPGNETEALSHYNRALELKPRSADAHNDIGLVLASLPGRRAEAIAHYEAALKIKPDFAEAHANLANALAKMPGRLDEALAHYERALRLNPNYPEVFDSYGNALALLPGHFPEAVAQYEAALHLRPDYAEAHFDLANALARIPGREDDAISHYEAALGARPGFYEAHANLASVLEGRPGRLKEAISHYEESLRLNPDSAWVHLALALQLSNIRGREADAAFHAAEALRIRPDYAEAHNCLAILCAQQGRFQEARNHWEQALRINPAYVTARENLRQLERIQMGRTDPP